MAVTLLRPRSRAGSKANFAMRVDDFSVMIFRFPMTPGTTLVLDSRVQVLGVFPHHHRIHVGMHGGTAGIERGRCTTPPSTPLQGLFMGDFQAIRPRKRPRRDSRQRAPHIRFDLRSRHTPHLGRRTRRDIERHRRRPARRARNRRRYQHRAQARLRGRRGSDEGGNDQIIKSRRARGLPPASWTQRVWPNKKGPAEFPLPPRALGSGLDDGPGQVLFTSPYHRFPYTFAQSDFM